MAKINTAEMPTEELPIPDTSDITAPIVSDMEGDKQTAPLKIIGGLSVENLGATQEAKKSTNEQNKVAPKTLTPDKRAPIKKERGNKPINAKSNNEPEADKFQKAKRVPRLPKGPKEDKHVSIGGGSGKTTPTKEPINITLEQPQKPKRAPRHSGGSKIAYINLSELQPFKNHPFSIRDDAEMKALVESVKIGGVNQPAIVRPLEDGGYEIIAGHRRQKASKLAGYFEMPCIVREMTDDEAILAMTDDNLRQRSEILPSEKAASLKMQFEAIKHQGTQLKGIASGDVGKRSIEIVGERNNMIGKQVQRYIRLNELVPDLQKAIDEKKMGFTPAVEISFISLKNQNLIAVSMDGQQSAPSLSQAKRIRELDQKNLLNGDVIDGILCEQKKEVDRVIISGEELNKYFGKDKTPQEMKNQIIKLLDEWAGKEKVITAPERKPELAI